MKNFFKSLFITLFPTVSIIVFIQSCIKLQQNGFSFHLLGNIISSFTIIFFFAGLFIKPRARTSTSLNVFSIFIAFGILINFIDISLTPFKSILPVFPLIIGWILYLKWYSVFKNRDKTILKVGCKLPLFELENTEGEKVLSDNFLGKTTIFIFYRGNWCPLCMAQIKEVVAEYKELEKRNVTMVLISPQPHKYTKSLADKFQVPFHFLKDAKNFAAKKLGIFQNAGIPAGFQVLGFGNDTVMPTVIITDITGEIIFTDLTDNYRVRPEPKVFLNIIDNLQNH